MMPPLLRLLRPKQWLKNGFVAAPIFFANQLHNLDAWYDTVLAVLCFSCIASTAYIFNDAYDIREDKLHPVKKRRPIASGDISILQAVIIACVLAALALFMLTILPFQCAVIAVIYIVLNLGYTIYLKRIAIVDVFVIAFCYVLRVLMGCYAISVVASPWIILTTFLLALFLGFGKRYHEMGFEEYIKYKPNLQNYNRALLDRLVAVCGGAALMTYAIYTAEIARVTGHVDIVYTVAFVAFGLFRYLQSLYVFNKGGEPEIIVMTDPLQILNFVLWLPTTLWLMH